MRFVFVYPVVRDGILETQSLETDEIIVRTQFSDRLKRGSEVEALDGFLRDSKIGQVLEVCGRVIVRIR